MHLDPLKLRLADGGCAFGTAVMEVFTPGIAAICSAAGAEFIFYDTEHSGAGIAEIKAQMAWCIGAGMVPIVRVPALEYQFVARVLDAGAVGVMAPMIETAEQAERLVSFTRYPPHGIRGAAFGVAAHDGYGTRDPVETMARALERTMAICLVETPRGIANVAAIAAVPGVDVVWLGHFDLTNFMGIPAQFDHPDYRAAVDRLLAACALHGKTPAILVSNETAARRYRALGFRLIAYGPDVILLRDTLATGLATLRDAVPPHRE